MKRQWILETNGAPLETLHRFLTAVWEKGKLDHMLTPIKSNEPPYWSSTLVSSPKEISKSNPFTPLMTENSAKKVPGILKQNPEAKIGIVLRPCEMRGLIEMGKHQKIDLSNVITISTDCLGTFPADEYNWRVERKGSHSSFSSETIQFSSQGGIVPYRYRSACQMCEMPFSQSADINIGVIGLPVRKHMLIMTPNGIGEKIPFNEITDREADEAVISQHEKVSEKLIHRRKAARERIGSALEDSLPNDLEQLIVEFLECNDCQICLDTCPICDTISPTKGSDGKYKREDILSWLTSCVGCGMCEQNCPAHKPLAIMLSKVKQSIPELSSYFAGLSPNDPLPKI